MYICCAAFVILNANYQPPIPIYQKVPGKEFFAIYVVIGITLSVQKLLKMNLSNSMYPSNHIIAPNK